MQHWLQSNGSRWTCCGGGTHGSSGERLDSCILWPNAMEESNTETNNWRNSKKFHNDDQCISTQKWHQWLFVTMWHCHWQDSWLQNAFLLAIWQLCTSSSEWRAPQWKQGKDTWCNEPQSNGQCTRRLEIHESRNRLFNQAAFVRWMTQEVMDKALEHGINENSPNGIITRDFNGNVDSLTTSKECVDVTHNKI